MLNIEHFGVEKYNFLLKHFNVPILTCKEHTIHFPTHCLLYEVLLFAARICEKICNLEKLTSKKIINKNEKIWFHSSKKTSYIPEKDINSKYNFREARWQKGVIVDGIVNEGTRQITRAVNKTFSDLSLTKTDDFEWGKRKIIHSIKVKIEKIFVFLLFK